MRYYRDFFRGKIVFCNCDDPYESNFFKYFAMNFNSLGLKKLVATCYAASPVAGDELEYYLDNNGQLSFVPIEDTPPPVQKTARIKLKSRKSRMKTVMGESIWPM